nr:basic salivary proline-rich protein 4-like [Nerophis lumbriciformis]
MMDIVIWYMCNEVCIVFNISTHYKDATFCYFLLLGRFLRSCTVTLGSIYKNGSKTCNPRRRETLDTKTRKAASCRKIEREMRAYMSTHPFLLLMPSVTIYNVNSHENKENALNEEKVCPNIWPDRPHAARPASDRNPRARPTVPPVRASSRPQTDAPGRGQGTREAGDSQTSSQRETTPHTGRKAGHPPGGAQRLPATGREDRPRPTSNRATTSQPPTPGEHGAAHPRPPHPSRPTQDRPARGHGNHPPHPQGPQRWRWNNQQPPCRVTPRGRGKIKNDINKIYKKINKSIH